MPELSATGVLIAELVGIATNFTIIVTGIKLIRHLSRMEMKVEMMWGVFMRQFGERVTDKNLLKDGE